MGLACGPMGPTSPPALARTVFRRIGVVQIQRRTEPAFHFPHFSFDLEPAPVDIPAAFLPHPLQIEVGFGKRACRKHQQEAVPGVRDSLQLYGGVDHGIGPGDERFLVQADPLVVEDPHAVPLVRLDHKDGVVHRWHTSMSLNRMSNSLPGWIWSPIYPFTPTLRLRWVSSSSRPAPS